jgi:Capsule assembly protein Wzi
MSILKFLCLFSHLIAPKPFEMNPRYWLVLLFISGFSYNGIAQSSFVPLNQDYYHLIDRYEIRLGKFASHFHSNVKPFTRQSVVQLLDSLRANKRMYLSRTDKWTLNYLEIDNWEWKNDTTNDQSNSPQPILKHIYKKKTDFFSFQNNDLDVHTSPVLDFGMGIDIKDNLRQNDLIINTRGVEIRGVLNKKLGFYTYFSDNQITQPTYLKEYARQNKTFPYESFVKVIDNDSVRMHTNYFSARGYFVFKPLKNLEMQFGHDRNFIGSGIRSMILSDFSAPYLHLKNTVQVGRFQYVALFAQLQNTQLTRPTVNSVPLVPKYFSFHHINFNLTKNFNFGLFESVMFGKRQVGFDPNYLNPVIFYRFVEGLLGSSDNVIVGADFKGNFLQTASVYGQFVLDEFNLKENKKNGWWAKKYGGQLGIKYIDAFLIDNLDLQAEFNFARPYLYSHFSTYSNYVHYNLPMAHPLGANFKEYLFSLRYQPFPQIMLHATYLYAQRGEDKNNQNFGGNILRLNTDNRPNDYGNTLGQGDATKIKGIDINLIYMLRHNFFIEMSGYLRNYDSTNNLRDTKTETFSAKIRWNLNRMTKLI